MKRTISTFLRDWSESDDRKPLIIRGARQVGKSWSVAELGKTFPGQIHVVNLEQRPDWHSVFDLNLDAHRIVRDLEVLLNRVIQPGRDLLFFDEIQECPKALQSLRYFYEQIPELHVISAGSLLEFSLQDLPFPVGRVQMMDMYPMTFGEFLEGTGQSGLAGVIQQGPKTISESIHRQMIESLSTYFAVGGMPACVMHFATHQSIQQVRDLQHGLLATLRQDFLKYTPYVNTQCLQDVYTTVANSVGQQISYTRLSVNFTGPTNKRAFDLLTTARLVHKVPAVSPLAIPLAGQITSKHFKAIFLDIGLLTALHGAINMTRDHHPTFRGSVAEQFVGQELIASHRGEVYYWKRDARNSQAEIDYVVAANQHITPIEVKSGDKGRLRSMHLLLKENPAIRTGYVLSDHSYAEADASGIVYVPLYWAGYI